MSEMRINSPIPTAAESIASDSEKANVQKNTAMAADLAGVKESVVPLATPNLSTPATNAEVQAALAKLEGTAPEIQQAVSQCIQNMQILSQNQAGNVLNAKTLDGLVNSVITAAKENRTAPFYELHAYLSDGVDDMIRATPENAQLKIIGESAHALLDLLQKPGDSRDMAKTIAGHLEKLADASLCAANASAEEKFAAAFAATLHNVLSVAAEANLLGDAQKQILADLAAKLPQLAKLQDAAAFSANALAIANTGLLMIMANQVQAELNNRIELVEAEAELAETLKKKEAASRRTKEEITEGQIETNRVPTESSSVFVSALGKSGDEGFRMINDLILKHQANSASRGPV